MINSAMMLAERRIQKELERDLLDYKYRYKKLEKCLKLTIEIDDNILKFMILEGYPFKTPIVYVNNINYRDRHKDKFLRYKELLKLINETVECPCCDTVLCKWSAGNSLIEIIKEYKEREEIYKRLKMVLNLNILRDQMGLDDLLYNYLIGYI